MPEKQIDLSPKQMKAGPDDGLKEGQFSAYASVFGNVDSYGDVVQPGAFAKSLEAWEKSGRPIPLLFGHNFRDPDFNLGHIVKAVEDERGLLVTAELDLENPKSAQVYRMLKGRRVDQMSFAYDVIDAEPGVKDEADVLFLKELGLHEVSVVPMGANRETEVLAVKAAVDALKSGRAISAKNEESLKEARESMASAVKAIDDVLSANEGGKSASDVGSAKGPAEDKTGAAGAEPAVPADDLVKSGPSVDLVAAEIELLALGAEFSNN